MSQSTPTWRQPSHPDRIKVARSDQPFRSAAYSLISLPAGALFARITTAALAQHTTYATVAISKDKCIDLNSDLVYCNHSCNPSLIFDMGKFEVRVVDDRPLHVGDALTFFYPSSEWTMAQPFHCECGIGDKCVGMIGVASNIKPAILKKYWLNAHIKQFIGEKMRQGSTY